MTIFEKKDKIQRQALTAWGKYGYRGLVAMCTGSGKTRVGILASKLSVSHNSTGKILIICPTEKLRDIGWADEFKKWKEATLYKKNVETVCYASLGKLKNKEYSLVIMDEAHNITEPKVEFFTKNKVKSILALTATPPKDTEKRQLFRNLNIKTIFKYTLEQGVKDGVVAPFNITVIKVPLDAKTRYLTKSKSKKKFTEQERYKSYSAAIRVLMARRETSTLKFLFMHRMNLIYKLRSKMKAAKSILAKHYVGERSLIFCADIKQSEALCKNTYHSKTTDVDFNKFLKKKLNKLACVKKLNEGVNIPDLDSCLIVQLSSKDKDLIQRIGRVVRWRKGHEAKVWILVAEGTQDEKWAEKALEDFDPNRITYTTIDKL